MKIDIIKNAKTSIIGKDIIYFAELDSTQNYAKQHINKIERTGTIVITDLQIQGKGTKQRNWYSSKDKNITMTIVLKPNCEISKLEGLTIQIAEAIKNAIKELYDYNLEIKEPNDLLLNNKKICGILTESSTISNKVNYILIGIGFNVNEEKFNEEIEDIATSLKREYRKEYNKEEIIAKIIENIEKIISNW